MAIPKTTEVLVIQTAKQGITPEQIDQIVALMPLEIRATVKLYFEGKIEFDTPDWPTSIIRSGPPIY